MKASWVAIDLMEFAVRTEDAVQSPEAALEWLRSFRDTLLMEGRNSSPMPWAVELLGMADVKIAKKSIARMQGQIVKIYGKDCDVDLKCSKKYGEKYEKLKKILAAATTREVVDESTTGCNPLTADASTREGEDERQHPSNGKILDSGTSANHYDQEAKISTNSPDASSGNAEGVNLHGYPKGSRAACTSSTSGQTIEALEQAGEGGVSPEVGCQASQPPSPISKPKTDPKPVKKKAEPEGEPKFPHGEFENIMLTTKEYIQLCERLDNADSLIDEADQYFEAQPDKKKKYKSHYAMLLNWDRRRKEVETPSRVRRFKTAVDQDREEIQKIANYYAAKNRGEQPPMPKLKMVEAV